VAAWKKGAAHPQSFAGRGYSSEAYLIDAEVHGDRTRRTHRRGERFARPKSAATHILTAEMALRRKSGSGAALAPPFESVTTVG